MGDGGEERHGGTGGSSHNPESPLRPRPAEDGTAFDQCETFKAIQAVERDSFAIAQSFTSLFASLRFAFYRVTSTSVDHMQCFTDATGRLQESDYINKYYILEKELPGEENSAYISSLIVLDAASQGNGYINSCLRLNEEMKGIDGLASQLKILRRHTDALDSAVNKLLHVT